jgi:hypothetical protein
MGPPLHLPTRQVAGNHMVGRNSEATPLPTVRDLCPLGRHAATAAESPLLAWRSRIRTHGTAPQEVTTMSNAPLGARPFRFLAVVASASFIVLMLGTGSQADQTTSVSLSPAFSSKSLRSQILLRRRLAEDLHYPEVKACNDCRQKFYDKCMYDKQCRPERTPANDACDAYCQQLSDSICTNACNDDDY